MSTRCEDCYRLCPPASTCICSTSFIIICVVFIHTYYPLLLPFANILYHKRYDYKLMFICRILSNNMQRFRLIALLLSPSVVSFWFCTIASLLVLVIANWSYTTQDSYLYPVFYGPNGLATK